MDFKKTFKLDDDPARRNANSQRREYSVSKVSIATVSVHSDDIYDIQDPDDWKYVERLLAQSLPKTIPVPSHEPGSVLPSGFRMPTAKMGDFEYFVKRNPNWMLPVYVSQKWHKGNPQATITSIKSVQSQSFSLV